MAEARVTAWFRRRGHAVRTWLHAHWRSLAVLAGLAVVAHVVAGADPKFIGDWFANLTFLPQSLFVARYWITSKPLRYPGPGRAVWVKATALAILIDVIFLAKHWPWLPFLEFVAAYGEVLIVVGIYWQYSAFERQRWDLRQEDRREAERRGT